MLLRHFPLFAAIFGATFAIYPYFDTQDFIYNVPKVFRITITLDKLLDYYEKKPSKDPEWYIALGLARGQMEYTINELDKSVPAKLKENLQNITRKMDRIKNATDATKFVYRSKDYEYVSKAIVENMDVLSSMLDPITLGTMGTQKPYRYDFEQYVKEARNKMPTRKAADACIMQLLISAMESQTTQNEEGTCELTPECRTQLIQGSGLAYQQLSRVQAAQLARLFDCVEGVDLSAHIYKLCVQVYKETKSLEAWDHPPGTRTLFMQQIVYCASQGYGEFIKPRWMNKVVSWQEPRGCYADDRQPFLRLTGYVPAVAAATKEREEDYKVKKVASSEGGTCNSLTSAAALGSLVIYVRALLETDQAFQYDVLE